MPTSQLPSDALLTQEIILRIGNQHCCIVLVDIHGSSPLDSYIFMNVVRLGHYTSVRSPDVPGPGKTSFGGVAGLKGMLNRHTHEKGSLV